MKMRVKARNIAAQEFFGGCNVVFLPFLLNTQHLYMSCIAQLVACMSSLRSWICGLRYVLSLTQNKDENRFKTGAYWFIRSQYRPR